ncbi:11463_t:CDS:2 [Paraglomus brasilianum]|uniref:11463_t:CDS:1 n=1 Tax=Paraglomus brasilianum TaxID=144538 RepID=A0A9N9GAP1_9GLOM|nr:11463_t:CDS:2 [Paraglomus brasilianum]
MDREYTKFAFHYAKDYPEKTEDDAYAAYMASKQESTDAAFTKKVLHLAFQTEFQDIVQSSGYGKTRAIIQLATAQPLIYVCLHQVDSIGYPPMTPKSSEMLSDIEKAESIDDAKEIASQWLELIIWVFCDITETDKIAIFLDESFRLLENKKGGEKLAFHAIHRVLHMLSDYAYGILTDTNSSAANLAPWQEKIHQHEITNFASIHHSYTLQQWIAYSSLWVAKSHSNEYDNFCNIINLAKFKLLGGVATWHKLEKAEKRAAAVPVIASTAVLYVSPVSSIAVELVRTHMAILIAVDDSCKFLVITYPSEPLLSEAAFGLMSVESA